jgi:hypothetical protein
VTLGRHQRSVDLRFSVTGNAVHDDDLVIALGVKPVRGLVAGDWTGALIIQDDDPQPRVSARGVRTGVVEGDTLRWRFGLAAVSHTDTMVTLTAAPPSSGTEVSTDDVPAAWLEQWASVPDTPTALSALPLSVTVVIPAGETRAFLDVPTSRDSRTEGTEGIAFAVDSALPGLPAGTRITGTVADPS